MNGDVVHVEKYGRRMLRTLDQIAEELDKPGTDKAALGASCLFWIALYLGGIVDSLEEQVISPNGHG